MREAAGKMKEDKEGVRKRRIGKLMGKMKKEDVRREGERGGEAARNMRER